MKSVYLFTFLTFGLLAVQAFGGNEDKFIKKYAMMKVTIFSNIIIVLQSIIDEIKYLIILNYRFMRAVLVKML